ncbi:MAG: tetratricopeptide repeat protein [Ignavibacteria bacterium]|nr:tetratricopeptide repeat protein [Ignavibacteria bacterium]
MVIGNRLMKFPRVLLASLILTAGVNHLTSYGQVDVIRSASVAEEQDYAFAYGLFRDSLYQFAFQQFSRFLENYPTSARILDAQYLRIESLFQQAEYESATNAYVTFVKENPNSRLTDDAYFRMGESHLKTKKNSAAIDAFKTVVDKFGSSDLAGEAAYWIGESYARADEHDNALKYYLLAYEHFPNNRLRDYSLYSIGWTYQIKRDYAKAIEAYQKLFREFPESDLASASLVRIGECFYYTKDYRKAIEELSNAQSMIKTEQEKGEAEYLIGEAYYHLGDYAKAQTHYETFLRVYPNHSLARDVTYALGWSYLRTSEFGKAIEVFDRLVEGNDPTAQAALFRKGMAQKLAGQRDVALKTWNSVTTRWPVGDYTDNALYESGIALYEHNKPGAAKVYFDRVIEGFSRSDVLADAYRMQGECLIADSKFEPARASFEKAMALADAPYDVKLGAHFQFGWSLFKLKRFADASAALTRFVSTYDKHPKTLDARYWLGESEYQRGNYAAALREYQLVAQSAQAEKREDAMYGAGWSLYKQNEFGKALEFFERLVATYPTGKFTFDARLRIGDCHYFLKDYSKAAGSYRATIRMFPKQESVDYAYYQLGQTYYRSGDQNEAVQQFTTLIRSFPKSNLADDAQYSIGWISFQNKKFSEAILEFQKLIQLYPSSELVPRAHYSIGDSYFNQQKYAAAEKAYRETINRFPASTYVLDAITGIQYCLIAQGKQSEALDAVDSFIRQHPSLASSEALILKKAELFYAQREYQQAAREYQAFAERFPKSANAPSAWYWAGKSQRALGRMNEAAGTLENAGAHPLVKENIAIQALLEAAEVYIEAKRYDRAIVVLSDLEKKYPRSDGAAEAIYLRGVVFRINGDMMEARNQFTYTIERYSSTSGADKARVTLAKIDLEAGDLTSALTRVERVSTSRTDEVGAEAQYLVGSIHAQKKDWPNAITAFLRVRYVFPRYEQWLAKAYLSLGNVYEQTQDVRKAREIYQNVLKIEREKDAVREAELRLKNLERM